MRDFFTQPFKRRYSNWLNRRIPRCRSITLNQRRIFIFPSRPGRWFITLLVIMLLAAINYQNNMAFALVFLLASVFIVSILHTYANLSGLTIRALRADSAFAGDNAAFHLSVSREGTKDYFDVSLNWPNSEMSSVSLTDNSQQTVLLHLPVAQRGLFIPPRLLVESFYPVGLLRSWTWLAMDIQVLVYPRPMDCALEGLVDSDDYSDGEIMLATGSDDFYQFKVYQPGDSIKHLNWKGLAKGQTLQSKHYAAYREQRLWLNFDNFSGDVELRLSKLCYWVLKLEQSNNDYGLRLPRVEFLPAHGNSHQIKLLEALALFNSEVKTL